MLTTCGTEYHLSIDLKDPRVTPAIVELVAAQAPEMAPRIYLCHPDLNLLLELRGLVGEMKLMHSTRLERLSTTPERHAAILAEAGIQGINMHHTDWNGGLVALFHRFGLMAFAWDLQFEHVLRPALRMGIDAVYCDDPDLMVDAFAAEIGQI
jgi:glycerophosphoryl diester phosphodiesterase